MPTREELGRLYPIHIEPYHPDWPALYANEKEILLRLLGPELAGRIEHIGSTSVAGLAAKPTVDILVEIPRDPGNREEIVLRMKDAGYLLMTEQTAHLMFVRGYTPVGLAKESFHIHMGPADQAFLWDRVYFRDYLRKHPSAAREYEALKRKLAEIHRHDREAYTDSKGEFIARLTREAKVEAAAIHL